MLQDGQLDTVAFTVFAQRIDETYMDTVLFAENCLEK